MDFEIREATLNDIRFLETCPWPEITHTEREELVNYENKYFTDLGMRNHVVTGQPDTVFVAEFSGEVVGYIHFWTDCWDGYEKHLVGLAVKPTVSAEDAMAIKTQLKLEMDEDF